VIDAVLEQSETEALAAISGGHAELRDVSDVVGDAGAEEHSDQCTALFVAEYPGGLGVEDAAAGESGRCCGGSARSRAGSSTDR